MQDAEILYGLTLSDSLAELVIDKRKATSRKSKHSVMESTTQPQHNNLATATQPPPPPSSLPSTSNAQPLPTVEQAFKKLTTLLDNDELENLLNKLFLHLALSHNITSNPGNFCSLSIKAMELLKKNNKNNLVYKFALALCKTKPDTDEPVFPMDRMPFGLVEYQIEFFSCTHIRQVNAVVLMYNLDKKCIGSFPKTSIPPPRKELEVNPQPPLDVPIHLLLS